MKIATIAIFCDDLIRLPNYRKYVAEYIDDIAMQIIVDNGSVPPLAPQLQEAFPDATVISMPGNGGVTAANNAGIKAALANPEIDSIMLLGNDVELQKGGMKILHDYLFSDPKLGMVAPPLMNADSTKLESFGFYFNAFSLQKNRYFGGDIDQLPEKCYCGFTPGAGCLAKREFYEKVGLQDELLFIYADETDMALRGKKQCFLEGVTSRTLGWHRHIPTGKDAVFDFNMMLNRNKAYIFFHKTNPLRGCLFLIAVLYYRGIRFIYHIGDRNLRKQFFSFLKGLWYGICKKMDIQLCRLAGK